MKAALIRFERWFLNKEEYSDIDLLNVTYNLSIAEIKRQLTVNNIDTIIGEMWGDGWAYKHTNEWYTFLQKLEIQARKLGIKNFFLAVGQCHEYQEELDNRNLSYKIIKFHWPVQEIINSYRRLNKTDDIKPWNSNTGRFFFPGGFPARPKRIGMLSKFYDEGMLKNAEWSFFPPWTEDDKKWCRNYLKKYTDNNYKKFLKYCTRELDPVYKQIYQYSNMSGINLAKNKVFDQSWWSVVGYLDNKIYNNTSLSVINEGPGNDLRFLTEKLWLAIFNKHPFILLDSPERFQYCKDIGLRMFEDYVKVKDYGYIEDPEEQMNAVIENTKYFLENLQTNKDRIQEDITHNHKVFYKHVDHNKQQEEFLKQLVVGIDIHKYLEELYLGNYIDILKIK
tara:strand:- start:18390 stop:19568 length:1179 start_codon:yes stop_codon:yes gene_type:complete